MLTLLGLQDSYVHDGRVLTNLLYDWAVPQSLTGSAGLGAIYKQLNAPFGEFSMSLLTASTCAVKSGSASGDDVYTDVEEQIAHRTDKRDALAVQISAALDSAAFEGAALNAQKAKVWTSQANALLLQARQLAKNACA